MLNTIFSSVITAGTITPASFFLSTAVAFALGLCIALCSLRMQEHSQSFVITLALLPMIVEVVIMLVNGNLGAGVAVAGAFSLVRFRSAQGTGQEITQVFLAMAVGLAAGMGYLTIAAILTGFVLCASMLLYRCGFGTGNHRERTLRVTIPETLDFEGVFDDLFAKYTASAELMDVRTTGMGSLYRLSYRIVMRDGVSQKQMIDDMRARNGNLEIVCSREVRTQTGEL